MSKIPNDIFVQLKKDAKILQQRARSGYSTKLMPYPVPPHTKGHIVMWAYDGKLISGKTREREFFSFQYIYKGNVNENIAGKLGPMHEKDMLLVQPNVRHGVSHEGLSPVRKDTCVIYFALKKEYVLQQFLHFVPEQTKMLEFFLNPFSSNNVGQYLILQGGNSVHIHDIVGMIISEYVERKPYYRNILNDLFATLIVLLSRDSVMLNADIKRNNTISQILSYLSENCIHADLQTTAKEFGYHPNYLSALLRKETGKNFSALIRDYRLEKACFMIANSEIPINEVARLVGYSTPSHFYKTFREKYGVMPSSFR